MKKKIFIGIIAVALATSLTGCMGGETIHNSGYMNEWISPDGVHYWKESSSYMGYMAPRYGHEGNLVIENWDVQ